MNNWYGQFAELLKGVCGEYAYMTAFIIVAVVFFVLLLSVFLIIRQLIALNRNSASEKDKDEALPPLPRDVELPPLPRDVEFPPLPKEYVPGGEKKPETVPPLPEEMIPPVIPGMARGYTVIDEIEGTPPGQTGDPSGRGAQVYLDEHEIPELELRIVNPNGTDNRCRLRASDLSEMPGRAVLIGRDPRAQLRFLDQGVSKKHLHLGADFCGYWIEDIGSSNGTFLNGEKCEEGQRCYLVSGDCISLGHSELHIQMLSHERRGAELS